MRARLTLESGDAHPRELHLDGTQIVKLGRNRDNHLVLRDQHASRFHAEIYRDERTLDAPRLRQHQRHSPQRLSASPAASPLEDGCEIRVGDICFRFALEPPEAATEEVEVPRTSSARDDHPPSPSARWTTPSPSTRARSWSRTN